MHGVGAQVHGRVPSFHRLKIVEINLPVLCFFGMTGAKCKEGRIDEKGGNCCLFHNWILAGMNCNSYGFHLAGPDEVSC